MGDANAVEIDGDSVWEHLKNNKIVFLVIELLGLGVFGLDRIFIWDSYWWLGLIKLVTGGGFGIWAVVDYVLVMYNGVMGYDFIDILWMTKAFTPSTTKPAQWVSIIGLVITFCCPGVFTAIFGAGFLGSIPILGRFFRKADEPTLIEHEPPQRSCYACCGAAWKPAKVKSACSTQSRCCRPRR